MILVKAKELPVIVTHVKVIKSIQVADTGVVGKTVAEGSALIVTVRECKPAVVAVEVQGKYDVLMEIVEEQDG